MLVARYCVSAVLAFGVAFGLFSLMAALLITDDYPEDEEFTLQLTDIAILDSSEKKDVAKDQKLKKPKINKSSPALPRPDFSDFAPAMDALSIPLPDMGLDKRIGFSNVLEMDSEYLPIFKVTPQYPIRALQRGLEGYVLLEFTVTEQGTVKDPRVIEAQPPRVFDRAAIHAALKFKYKPRIIKGKPTEVSGVRNKITFVLDQ